MHYVNNVIIGTFDQFRNAFAHLGSRTGLPSPQLRFESFRQRIHKETRFCRLLEPGVEN